MSTSPTGGARLRVVYQAVAGLRPSPRNPRVHPEAQLAAVAASMRQFDWTNPILAAPDGEIIAGEARWRVAQQLGLEAVPVIVLAHLTPAQRDAYRIADNRLPEGASWNEALLAEVLDELAAAEFPLDGLGFTEQELNGLLDGLDAGEEADPAEEAVPEPPADPVTRYGDLWRLGAHRLLCGDATEEAAFRRLLGEDRAALCFTDPPYNVAYEGKGEGRLTIENDALGEAFGAFLEAACRNLLSVTDGAVYLCMSSSELHTLRAAFLAAGGHWSTFVIWAKDHFTLGRSDYQRQYEPILYGWREGARRYWCGARDQSDVWHMKRPYRNALHPTMKPVELVRRALCNSSRRGDLVLDPFGGSGSTLIACDGAARRARLIEFDPRYCDVIVRRWQDLTGGQAVHDASGAPFGA